jgi:hypothetical protein
MSWVVLLVLGYRPSGNNFTELVCVDMFKLIHTPTINTNLTHSQPSIINLHGTQTN